MLNENTFLIEKLQHDLTQDIEQWLSFSDLSEEEQNDEYNLKRQLYDDMEAIEQDSKEYWIEELLKPELKGKYNRATKQFIRDTKKTIN